MGKKALNKYHRISDTEMALYCDNTIVIFDTEDFERIKDFKWSIGRHGYATSGAEKRQVLMHRLVMDAGLHDQIDHINRVKVDNRKCNLRFCSSRDNAFNKGPQQNNQIGVKGVCLLPDGAYQAQICFDKQSVYLGRYKTLEEAAQAYDAAARYFAGEFAFENLENSLLPDYIVSHIASITCSLRRTPAELDKIDELRRQGMTMKKIAREIGCSVSCVQRYLKGETYRREHETHST